MGIGAVARLLGAAGLGRRWRRQRRRRFERCRRNGPAGGDPDFNAGLSAADRQDWQAVIDNMNKVVERDDQNADAWNHLGHAYRLLGDMDNSFKHYEVALRINPRHRRAHEYVGEAYLQVGDLPGAEQHLKVLDKLCWLPCEEYTDLKEKVEQYKREKAQ
jgi:tetratricopeptide (TPR) repeat protein